MAYELEADNLVVILNDSSSILVVYERDDLKKEVPDIILRNFKQDIEAINTKSTLKNQTLFYPEVDLSNTSR